MSPIQYTAQVCVKGHLMTDSIETDAIRAATFCTKCGAQTITACPSCSAPLRGDVQYANVIAPSSYQRAAFCYKCGRPYPWTTAAMEALTEAVQDDGELTDLEKQLLVDGLGDLAAENPETEASARRWKRFMTGAAEIIRALVVDIASETAKKILTDPS